MTYNTRSPAVKRLMKEAQELSKPTELFYAKPLEDNLFEWHFTIRGPMETDYDGGIYHGRILLPAEYPMKPPNILLLTPSGRFDVNRKICLSISGYHPETWRPSWSIRTALLAIIGFMPTHGVGAIGSLEYPPEERRKLAKSSVDFVCPQCGGVKDILESLTAASVDDVVEARNLAAQISFTGDKDGEDKAVKTVREVPESATIPPPLLTPVAPPISMTPHPIWPIQQTPLFSHTDQAPLSFEEWCRQSQSKPKVDQSCVPRDNSAAPSPGVVIAESCESVVTPNVVTGETRDDDDPVIIPSRSIYEDISSLPTTVPPTVATPRDPPTANITSHVSLSMDILRQRQSVLLHCMTIVAAILGVFLAVRLSGLGADTGL